MSTRLNLYALSQIGAGAIQIYFPYSMFLVFCKGLVPGDGPDEVEGDETLVLGLLYLVFPRRVAQEVQAHQRRNL